MSRTHGVSRGAVAVTDCGAPVVYEVHVEHFHPPHLSSGYRALARTEGERAFVWCVGFGRTVSEALANLEQRIVQATGRPPHPHRIVYALEP